MSDYLAERNQRIIELTKDYNFSEIGRKLGISRERVRQIVRAHGIQGTDGTSHKVRELKRSGLLGVKSDPELAEQFGLHDRTVAAIRVEVGLRINPKPIGCRRCKTKPYARGLCRPCWARAARRGELENYPLERNFDVVHTCEYDDCRRRTEDQYCWQHKDNHK